jgi:hypothetical protein
MVQNVLAKVRKAGRAAAGRSLLRDLKMLARFISVYCRRRHGEALQSPVSLKGYDLRTIAGKPVDLCPDCAKLLTHASVKRTSCPLEPKPTCKRCPQHCYHATYRGKMREVMRFSGRRLVLSGRVDYLRHLLL